jgi:hypothetical protein
MSSIIRKLLVGVAAVLAMSAVVPALASAAPPEFEGPFPNKFELTTPTEYPRVQLKTVSGREINCLLIKQGGEITSATTVTTKLVLRFCGAKGKGVEGCTSGLATNELTGKPVYINNKREVGIVFSPKAGEILLEHTCGSGTLAHTIQIRGSVIAPISQVYVKSKSFLLDFVAEAGIQKPTEYENELGELTKATLEMDNTGHEAFPYEQMSMAGASNESPPEAYPLITAEPTELKAQLASKGLPEFVLKEAGSHFPATFKGEVGSPTFKNETVGVWSASSATISGEIISPNEVGDVVMTFHPPYSEGCWAGKEKATVTTELRGRIGYLNKTAKTVGLLLEPASEPVANCTLRAISYQVRKSVIASLTPVAGFKSIRAQFSGAEKFEGESTLHHLELWNESENRSVGLLAFSSGEGQLNEFSNLGGEIELRR